MGEVSICHMLKASPLTSLLEEVILRYGDNVLIERGSIHHLRPELVDSAYTEKTHVHLELVLSCPHQRYRSS